MLTPKQILFDFWGYQEFRYPQEEIINSVLENKNTIALLPTGGGKSICYQIPSLTKPGICLVISPLISLMKDQVEALQRKKIKATYLASGMSQNDIISLFDNIKFNNYKFLYLSPERLQSEFIKIKLKELSINLIAVDEAHCISEWGHDFRPAYKNITVLQSLFPKTPWIAVTATATKKVLKDIKENLHFKNSEIFRKSFDRKNLAYQVFDIEDKLNRLVQIFTKTKSPAIIYVNTRKKAEQTAKFLNENGFPASFYHGGLSTNNKELAFENWMQEKTKIMVATNAFGMGIDKDNVGIVIHLDLPFSIENYIQEAGRAGRNGKKAFSVILQNQHDINLFKKNIDNTIPSLDLIKQIHLKLYQFFQIGNSEFTEQIFDFNLHKFCNTYGFPLNKTRLTIQLLKSYGIVNINSSVYNSSEVQFLISSKQVISIQQKSNQRKHLIQLLLRAYGGIFQKHTKIDEFWIAKNLSTTSDKIIEQLEILYKENIIDYKRSNKYSEFQFLVPREDNKTINKISKELVAYLKHKKEKALSVINFVENNKVCRNIQLLSYFNENIQEECEICDVCLAKKSINPQSILDCFTNNKSLSVFEIASILNSSEKDILIHLRFLLAEEKLGIYQTNKFYIK